MRIWPFRRFKGMIRPGMGVTWDDSRRIADRKSVAMVGYLRARRSVYDPLSPEWLRRFDLEAIKNCRAAHFRLARAAADKLAEAMKRAADSLGWAEAHLKDAGVRSAQVTYGERDARAALSAYEEAGK